MKNNIDTFLIELEKNNETFKKWGDLYRIEENIINTIISTRKKERVNSKRGSRNDWTQTTSNC